MDVKKKWCSLTEKVPFLKKIEPVLGKSWIFIKEKCVKSYEWYRNNYRKAVWYKKIGIVFATTIIAFLIYLFMVDINFLWLFGKSPGLSSISNPQQNIASEIYSADGKLINKFFTENRSPVEFKEISPVLIDVLISTEDERFYQHFGVDLQGVFAAIKDMMGGRARGASTITQQLVKNMFKVRSQYSTGLLGKIPGLKIIIMKSKEWITAVKIEMFYTKEEILTMYLNTVDFGSNTYGIKTASKTYFHTTPQKLKIEEAAVLVGLLKATTTYNPKLNPQNSKKRRNVVLDNYCMQKHITPQERDSLKELPILLNYASETNYNGKALYFREAVAEELEEWCKDNGYDIYSDGLKIYTTIDTRMQQYAEEAVQKQMRVVQRNFDNHWGKQNPWRDKKGVEIPDFIESLAKRTVSYKVLQAKFPDSPDSINFYLNKPHRMTVFDYKLGRKDTTFSTMDSIRYMQRFMHCGFIAMEPNTGHVKAWVGDVDFDTWKYDKVLSKRQPGSTFKLFVYAAAMNMGLSPCDERVDRYIDWEVMDKGELKKWIPRNADGNYSGDTLSLKAAFGRSINSVAVQLAREVGIPQVVKTAYDMGIKTKLNETPSVSLGASDVSLLELVNAYCTPINDGMAHDPVLVTRIEDRDGNVIYRHKPKEWRALPYESAFLVTQLLTAGLTEPMATSQALFAFDLFRYKTDFGGKTGTSSNHSDAWFVGVTPGLVGGAWVGGEHRSVHFRTGSLGQGSRTALPIFGYFMEKVLADTELSRYRQKFGKPKEPISRLYGCQTPYRRVEKDTTLLETDSISAIPTENVTIPEETPHITPPSSLESK